MELSISFLRKPFNQFAEQLFRVHFSGQSKGIFIREIFTNSLKRINRGLNDEEVKLAFEKIKETITTNSSLFEINKILHGYLLNGFNLSNGKDFHIKLLDPKDDNNTFNYCVEFSTEYNRQDLVLFINGLPLIIIECKSPFKNGEQIEYAFQQVKIYREETSYLFYFNLLSILKSIREFLRPSTVLDLLRNFVYFNKESKIIAQSHQYVATKKFSQQLLRQENKKGIIQHSQGAVTATPIEKSNRSTREVFGEVIHIYDRDQSVKDNITVGLIYYDRIVAPLEIEEESISHKVLFITSSREHAYQIHQLLQEKAGENQIAKEEICLDITISKKSPSDSKIREIIVSEEKQKREFYNFQNEQNPQIMIVVDKYTTGFDMPKLQLIYIDKYINQFHSLEQTIMRVNRRYPKKDKGVIVDFIGLGKNIEKISTILKYENIAEQVKQELTEIEQKLPLKKFGDYEEVETLLENETQRSLLKEKIRKFKSFYKYGQNQITEEQKKKMKDYMKIDEYLNNIEKVEIRGGGKNKKKKASPLNLKIGNGEREFSDPVQIDELLEEAKNLYKSHTKSIFLYSLWENMQPLLRILGSRKNKEWRERVKELLDQYNSYEDLATSLRKIIKEAKDKLEELGKDSNKRESYPFLQLLTDEESVSEEEKDKISRKVVDEIRVSGEENID
ncbi:6481_t:CDS:2 [Funneliformis geosporum]|nr:6481_t:CDS:2 [Funneliformis geosporum]